MYHKVDLGQFAVELARNVFQGCRQNNLAVWWSVKGCGLKEGTLNFTASYFVKGTI